jgi:GT2 family glycosyltransferase
MCRAYRTGIPVEYVPDMVVYHYHGRRRLDEIQRLHFDYCVGTGAIYAKYFFIEPRLLRHFYWDIRNALSEVLSGKIIDRKLGLSRRSVARGVLLDLFLYAHNWFKALVGFESKASQEAKK